MARQRYLQLTRRSAAQYSILSLRSFQDSSHKLSSCLDINHFIKEQRKILKTVRSQPWPMHRKVNVTRHYKAAITRYATLLDTFDTVKDTARQVKSKVKRCFIQLQKTLTIWNSIIKRIEGKFGSSVASYFMFLRWLCALNLFITLLIIFFVILPQEISGHGLPVPPEVKQNLSKVSLIFDGQGYVLQYSVLFYGYYDSGQNEPYKPPPYNPEPYIGFNYKLPLAYMLMIPITFGVCIIAILISIAEKYKLMQRADMTDPYPFSRRAFTGWDYAVTYANTAHRKAMHIATEFKELVADFFSEDKKELSVKILIIRIFSNGIIIALLCSSSFVIYVAVENVEKRTNYGFDAALKQGINGLWAFILSFQVQVVIVGRNMSMRGVFLLTELIERHHPRTALKLMLVRMFCLYISSLYMLIIALLTISNDCADTGSGEICCWENIVGQEMYKLSWTQMGAEILSIFFIDGAVWVVALWGPQKVKKYVDRLEFDIAHHVLQSIYSQALVWLGMLFCPLLPAINFFKCVFLFYIKLFGVMLFNRQPKAMFKISSTNNFYLVMLLLMLFLSVFPVGYAVLEITPSTICGPFRGQDQMMDVVNNEMNSWPELIQEAIGYLQTSAVVIPLLILLCIIIYYYGALSHVLKELNKDLQVQLILERRETRARIAETLRQNEATGEDQQFLINPTKHPSMDQLSVTSYDTYIKDKPRVLTHNAELDTDNNLSMYPKMSNTDDDDDECEFHTPCISDYSHPMPSTCVPPSYHQYHSTINCYHPTKYSRKQ